ncbi:MAG: hypothetical protein ACXVJT_09825 [Thermoanaerobaculia bacterium]
MKLSVGLTSAVALWFVIVPAMAAKSGQLHYQLPSGWVNLMDPAFIANGVPQAAMQEASSGRFVLYATDPSTATRDRLRASFNVFEQKIVVKINEAKMKQLAAGEISETAKTGATMTIENTRVSKIGDVPVGVITAMIRLPPQVTRRIVQYIVPGKTVTAFLSYSAAPEDFEKYRPAFEASAMATTGAYDHSGLSWKRVLRGALVGGIGGLAAYFVGLAAKKRRATAGVEPQSVATWECPTCKRLVPLDIEACHCGTARPA